MKKILVTGALGFVGSNLSNALHRDGFDVIGVDDEILAGENWEDDITNLVVSANPMAILHVGACADTLENSANFMMIRNYEATKILVQAAKLIESQFIYSSSAANYGINGRYPSNLYGWSKYVAEDYVKLNKGISLRYFNVYGPGEERKGKMSSFLYQAYLLNKDEKTVELFPGNPSRDFVHIEDVVSANIYALNNFQKFEGGVYEVSTGESHTFEEVLEIARIKYKYADAESIPEGYQFYTKGSKERHLNGWSPKVDLLTGVSSYVKHLATHG